MSEILLKHLFTVNGEAQRELTSESRDGSAMDEGSQCCGPAPASSSPHLVLLLGLCCRPTLSVSVLSNCSYPSSQHNLTARLPSWHQPVRPPHRLRLQLGLDSQVRPSKTNVCQNGEGPIDTCWKAEHRPNGLHGGPLPERRGRWDRAPLFAPVCPLYRWVCSEYRPLFRRTANIVLRPFRGISVFKSWPHVCISGCLNYSYFEAAESSKTPAMASM